MSTPKELKLPETYTSNSQVYHVYHPYKHSIFNKCSDDAVDPTNSRDPLATTKRATELAKPGDFIAVLNGVEDYMFATLYDHEMNLVMNHYPAKEWNSRSI